MQKVLKTSDRRGGGVGINGRHPTSASNFKDKSS